MQTADTFQNFSENLPFYFSEIIFEIWLIVTSSTQITQGDGKK